MESQPSKIELNARDLEQELAWFARVLDTRFKLYFDQEPEYASVFDLVPPEPGDPASSWALFLRHYQLSFAERLALVLGLVPHLRPQLLDVFHTRNQKFDRPFTEFGGLRHGPTGDFLPTGETLAFLLAAGDLELRIAVQAIFDSRHAFARHNILCLDPGGPGADGPEAGRGEATMKSPLKVSAEYLSYFTTGEPRRPDFGAGFPARYLETELTWDNLVLHPGTRQQIEEIETWLAHGETLMNEWGMAAKLRPGYRSLFYGPPGTGKTMTASLLGKSTGRDVYKVDLALVVSKYIGETEKNLARVFDQAQHKGWILFFDEADALFGKRSETKDAHDRYANQEVSFLLQRIETFDGIAILASNRREQMDDAFARRFESIIHFPMPRAEERLILWRQGFSAKARLEEALDLAKLAREHVLAGGAIMNVIRYASLQALKGGSGVLKAQDVEQGIRRELAKEGRVG